MPRQINTLMAAPWGPMIVSRLDRYEIPGIGGYGVGFDLLERGDYDPDVRERVISLLFQARVLGGPGVICFDVGANIGAFSIPWALAMEKEHQRTVEPWGRVIAFEPQRYVYQMLCANIMLNNVFHLVTPAPFVLGSAPGQMEIPFLDPMQSASHGSLSLRSDLPQDTGQAIESNRRTTCMVTTVDEQAAAFGRLDVLKIDAEGMEPEVLSGASEAIREFHPTIIAEVTKCGRNAVYDPLLAAGYEIEQLDHLNILARWSGA